MDGKGWLALFAGYRLAGKGPVRGVYFNGGGFRKSARGGGGALTDHAG